MNEELIRIKGGSLKGDFCNYSYEYVAGPTAGDEVKRSGSLIVHDDMKKAFKKLNPHLGVICEEVPLNKIRDIDAIEEYDDQVHKVGGLEHTMSKFSVEGYETTEDGVKLKGTKKLTTGDFINLTTPTIEWEGDYHFSQELRAAIDECSSEIEQYMYGKSAPRYAQTSLEFGEGDNNGDNNSNDN